MFCYIQRATERAISDRPDKIKPLCPVAVTDSQVLIASAEKGEIMRKKRGAFDGLMSPSGLTRPRPGCVSRRCGSADR